MELILESVPEPLRVPLARWVERAEQSAVLRAGVERLSAAQRTELPRAVAGSEFIAAALIQDPAALDWFARCDEPAAARRGAADYETQLIAARPRVSSRAPIQTVWPCSMRRRAVS